MLRYPRSHSDRLVRGFLCLSLNWGDNIKKLYLCNLKNNIMSVVVRGTRYSYRTKSGGIVTRTRKPHVRKSPRKRRG